MTGRLKYTIYKDGEEHNVTITPVKQDEAGGNSYSNGVFKLSEGQTGLGDIIFDDQMRQWEYTGLGNLTHQEAAEIAGFIQANQQDQLKIH